VRGTVNICIHNDIVINILRASSLGIRLEDGARDVQNFF
jgi:hypothetical protein